jgi:hypothetical protein
VVEFKPEKEPFMITIGENRFSYRGFELNIDDGVSMHGFLKFSEITPYYSPWYERGVMGWFGYVPFMETNHGILSLDHKVNGIITINGEKHEFREGRGYIEKDWGMSFPSSWIWMQSNGFKDVGSSFMLSIAVIPWLGSSFIGHLAILHIGTKTINLSTYRGGKITNFVKTEEGVKLTIQTKKHMLKVNAIQGDSVELKSPQKGFMTGRTIESLNSILKVKLLDKITDETLFIGIGHDSGLEIMDEKNELIRGTRTQ